MQVDVGLVDIVAGCSLAVLGFVLGWLWGPERVVALLAPRDWEERPAAAVRVIAPAVDGARAGADSPR